MDNVGFPQGVEPLFVDLDEICNVWAEVLDMRLQTFCDELGVVVYPR